MNASDAPIYDNTRLDLGIDPQDQQGHDVRVAHILHKYPSKLLAKEEKRARTVHGHR